jgi:L-lysine exporter family protein LysE/ArgO
MEGFLMSSIFTYIFLGVSLAAPIGPVKAVLLNTGIKNGFFHAWFFSLGALATDILYMLMVYLGVAQFIDSPLIKNILWSFGCFVLLYTGIENLLTFRKVEVNVKMRKYTRLRHSLFTGFFMSMLNPLTILFWLGIYGSILAKTAGSYSILQILINSAAILVGIIIVDLTMSFVSSGARKILTSKLLTSISILSSLSMIGFGIYFGIQAFISLFR